MARKITLDLEKTTFFLNGKVRFCDKGTEKKIQ